MGKKIKDLEIIIPEKEEPIHFIGKQDQQDYTIDVWVPVGAAVLLIEHSDTIINLLPAPGKPPKVTKDSINVLVDIIAAVCQEKYEHIDGEWIKKNISLPRIISILMSLLTPLLGYLLNSGLLEWVQPIKEPREEKPIETMGNLSQ